MFNIKTNNRLSSYKSIQIKFIHLGIIKLNLLFKNR